MIGTNIMLGIGYLCLTIVIICLMVKVAGILDKTELALDKYLSERSEQG